jgi:hypothetical protein
LKRHAAIRLNNTAGRQDQSARREGQDHYPQTFGFHNSIIPFFYTLRTLGGGRRSGNGVNTPAPAARGKAEDARIYSPLSAVSSGMDIDVAIFSATQQLALFDLLILAMYADGHLTTFEDAQLQALLAAMGHAEEPARQREFDAAVTRVRPAVDSIHKAKELALMLAGVFTTRAQQKQVFAAVEQMMTSDNHVSTWENTLLMELRMTFRL